MPEATPRMTLPMQRVLRFLLEDPARETYGLTIMHATDLASGTVYPLLARLEQVKWIQGHWERVSAVTEGRPRRRYYRLNPAKIATIEQILVRRRR